MAERAAIEAKIFATEEKLAKAETENDRDMIKVYGNLLSEQTKTLNILLAGSGNLNPMSLFFMSIVYAFSQKLSYISQSNNIDITRTCYLSMNYLLARALRLLCVESYVLMCPFYYSNYQSTLFCVESLIKFLAHNDVCVRRFIVPYFLTLP